MTLWQTSLTYRVWVWLCNVYEDSALHRILAAVGRWCSEQIEDSRVLRPLCREGAVAQAWRESLLCRLLSVLVNLPGTLLHAWYKAWNLTFEDSFFARLAFDMGDNASIAQFWCIAALWCIPYERWNNAYSFLTGVLLLLLFYAGAMRTGRRLDVARIGFYPVLLLASVALAVVFSYAPGLSSRFLIYHVSAALLTLITVSAVRNGEDLKRLCAGAAVCVGGTGAYGIVQRLQGVKVNPSYVDLKVNAGMPGRVYSIFDNPNTFAQVLLLLLPLVLALVITAKHWQWKVIAAGIFCVGGMAMAMTYSRAAWVGLACSMAVFVFLWKPKLIPAFIALCVLLVFSMASAGDVVFAGLYRLCRLRPALDSAVLLSALAALAHDGVRGNPCLFPASLFPELTNNSQVNISDSVTHLKTRTRYVIQLDGKKYRGGSTYCTLSDWKETWHTITDVPESLLIGGAPGTSVGELTRCWTGTLYQCKVYKGLLSDTKVNKFIQEGTV